MKLPIVSNEIMASMSINVKDKSWGTEKLLEIGKENPIIFQLLTSVNWPDNVSAMSAGTLVYMMLKSQLEAEEMNAPSSG